MTERLAACIGLGVGWELATAVLWVWADVPGDIVGLMFEASLLPVVVGLLDYALGTVVVVGVERKK